MLRKLVLAVVVGVIVTLACILLGDILTSLGVAWAAKIGDFLGSYSGVFGVLAGLWWFFSGAEIKRP